MSDQIGQSAGLAEATNDLVAQYAAIIEKQTQVHFLKAQANKEECELWNLTAKYVKQMALVAARSTEGFSNDTKYRFSGESKGNKI